MNAQNLGMMVNDVEKTAIINALEETCGNQIWAAKILGIHRNTLRTKIRKYGIDVGGFKK